MKKIFLLLLLIPLLYAGEEYISLHQFPDIYKNIGAKNQFSNPNIFSETDHLYQKNYLSIIHQFRIDTNVNIQCTKRDKTKDYPYNCIEWCGERWKKFKIYIPQGITRYTLGLATRPNATIAGILTFIPDGETNPHIDMFDYKTIFDFNHDKDAFISYFLEGNHPIYWTISNVGNFIDTFFLRDKNKIKSGWIYLNLAQADEIAYSWGGHMNNVLIGLNVQYYFKEDQTELKNWLKTTKFDPNGDPIETFSTLTEKVKSCNPYNIENIIHGNGSGEFLSIDQFPSKTPIDSSDTNDSCPPGTQCNSNTNQNQSNTSSSSSSSYKTQISQVSTPHISVNDEKKREECEAEGKTYVDGGCIGKTNTTTNSQPSYTTSSNSDNIIFGGEPTSSDSHSSQQTTSSIPNITTSNDKKREECEANEDSHIDGNCSNEKQHSSTTSSLTQESQDNDGEIQSIVKNISNQTFPIRTLFVRYGPGKNDFLFVAQDDETGEWFLFKFKGVKRDGTFDYKSIDKEKYGISIQVKNGKVRFIKR